MGWDRVGLAVGGVACLLVTPLLALAYYPAFGSAGEVPPPWADWLMWPTPVTGDPVTVYNTYGTVFGIGLIVVAGSFVVLVRRSTVAGSDVRRAWSVVAIGLGAVALGSLAEYGLEILAGFMVELLGFLVLIVGMAMLGVAVRREAGAARWTSYAVGLSGLGTVAAGTAIVGHLPSGPAFGVVAAGVSFAVVGLPSSAPDGD